MTMPLLRLATAQQVRAKRRPAIDPDALRVASEILKDIDARGDSAVLEHATRLGDLSPDSPVFYDREALAAALRQLPIEKRRVLERTAIRIASFANAQRECLRDLDLEIEGGRAGHTSMPVDCVGCYAPGGRFPLPSSVLMTAITARTAGVKHVWVASPKPSIETLAAAAISGADGLLAIGGAQAIGALANGACGVSPCDMIVGPGNKWVTAAKLLISDRVGIDMLAGPSELVVLADDSADPAKIAADLLAQAEHDTDAVPILITIDPTLPDRVEVQMREMLQTLPTARTATAALRNGFAVICPNIDLAIDLCDFLAPEHLQVMTSDAATLARRIRNAGALFMGEESAEVFGDYGAGPNHVLPTGASARFRAGLSVFTFLRARTWLQINPDRSASLRRDAVDLARMEGLEGHARAAALRLASTDGAGDIVDKKIHLS